MIRLRPKLYELIKSFVIVLVIMLAITVAFGLYIFGFLRGYNLAVVQNSQNQVATLPIKEIIYPTAPPTRPTSAEAPVVASWGGPELWEAVNKRRVELGVNPLQLRTELCTIASIRLNELLELGKLDGHEGFTNLQERRPDLKWIFERYSTLAEFLALGGESPQETVALWENTLGHSKLLTGGEYVWGCIYAQNSFAVAITAY